MKNGGRLSLQALLWSAGLIPLFRISPTRNDSQPQLGTCVLQSSLRQRSGLFGCQLQHERCDSQLPGIKRCWRLSEPEEPVTHRSDSSVRASRVTPGRGGRTLTRRPSDTIPPLPVTAVHKDSSLFKAPALKRIPRKPGLLKASA